MARTKIKVRLPAEPESDSDTEMLVVRGPKNIKQPTPKEIQGMKNREFIRKHPTTSI